MLLFAVSLPVLMGVLIPPGLLLGSLFSDAFRREFSKGPMGLRSRGRKKHSVLCTKDLPNLEAYVKSLSSGAKRNIVKADEELTKHNIYMTSRINTPSHACRALPALMSVILSHESRAWGHGHWIQALLDTFVRWLCIACMVGFIDEYWIDGEEGCNRKLVSFSHTVIKGNTLRGMWFYQTSGHHKKGIWFHVIKVAVERAILLRPVVQHVDIGPSRAGTSISQLKDRFGFKSIDDWAQECEYSGAYVDDLQHALRINSHQ
mmetsp:Transcript_12604/g.26598  ORF Transcript_12604/g.26598 Transcript_12604/m.26598 type:complete len:261 (-) Transcript_12604:1337-2119(-)